MSMKYKTHVFNFPSSPPLNAFFFSFLSNPRRSRPREPIKTTVHFHLPPWASQQSQLHHFILDYVEPFQSWVAGFAKTAVGLREHLEEGKMRGRLPHSSTLFYWKKQLRSSHGRQSKQKLTMLSTIQAGGIQMNFPPQKSPSQHLRLNYPSQHWGEEKSLHALFIWPNTA